jgi:threonine/homoserine/homoserine lactone efflux protein
MGGLISQVLPLALGSAVSPTLLAVTLLVLSSREKPRARGVFFVLGLLAILAIIGAIVLSAGSKSVQSDATHSDLRSAIVDLVLAGVLLLLGLRTLIHRPDPNRHDKRKPRAERDGVQARHYFVFGLFMMSVNFTTTILYIDALKEVAHADLSSASRGVVWAMLALFATLPALVPLVAYAIAPGPAERGLGRLNAYLTKHARGIGAGVCFVFAAYLAVKGARAL